MPFPFWQPICYCLGFDIRHLTLSVVMLRQPPAPRNGLLVACMIACLGPLQTAGGQQPSPLPPTSPPDVLASLAQDEAKVERFRRSFFQGFGFEGGTLFDLGDRLGGLNISHQEVSASFGVPLFSLRHILAVQPYFRADHLDGPTAIDIPNTLYDTGVRFFNRTELSERFSTTLLITPSIRSDFQTSEDAFRVFGLGLVNWSPNERWTFSAGAVYLDREDLSLLPAVGFQWKPRPDWKVDGVFPRPRVAKRVWKDGSNGEAWTYLGLGIGGNTWAVERVTGDKDQITLREFRLLLGYELILAGNRGMELEGGYSFGRSAEYTSDELRRDLDDGVFVRGALRF
ncbi:MAG: hypothetical protein AAGD07_04000 [Planctomycetota bacterium]